MATQGEKQPEAADILERAEHLRTVWSEAHAQWEEVDGWVQGTYSVWPNPEDRATRGSVRSNTARTIIDRTSDNLLPYAPQWHRDAIGRAEDAQSRADGVEKWVDAVWLDATFKGLGIAAKQLGRHFLKYNYGVLEVGFDPQDEPEEPRKGDENHEVLQREYEERQWNFNPFSLRAPHPRTVLLPPYERVPGYGVRKQKWYREELRDYLEAKRNADADNLVLVESLDVAGVPFQLEEVTEYFSPKWHGLVAATHSLLLVEANLTGLVPFTHAWGGFGDVPGFEDSNNPKYLAQGFLWPVRDLLRLLDQVISAKAELEMKAAYAPMVAPEELLERIASLLQQGANMMPGDVRAVGYLPIQQLPQYLADFQDRIERAIVTATVSTVTFGERPVGVDTVGQHAMMLQVSYKRMVETMEQIAFLSSTVGSTWLKMLAAWGRKVTVRGASLAPDDLQHNYHILARFPMTDEAVRQQRTQVGAGLVKAGLKSKRRHWEEDQGLTDISGEEDAILEDMVMADPVLMTAFAERKRQELGVQEMYEEQVRRLAQERAGVAGGGQQGQGPPGVKIPARSEETLVRGAEREGFVRPPPAGPGTGQPTNGLGT